LAIRVRRRGRVKEQDEVPTHPFVASLEFEGCSEEADGSGEVVTAITLPWRKNVVKTKKT
jgi:hypothetical protein